MGPARRVALRLIPYEGIVQLLTLRRHGHPSGNRTRSIAVLQTAAFPFRQRAWRRTRESNSHRASTDWFSKPARRTSIRLSSWRRVKESNPRLSRRSSFQDWLPTTEHYPPKIWYLQVESNHRLPRMKRTLCRLSYGGMGLTAGFAPASPDYKTGRLLLSYASVGPAARIELALRPYRGRGLPVTYAGMVVPDGVEPTSSTRQVDVLPLNYGTMVGDGRFALPISRPPDVRHAILPYPRGVGDGTCIR